MAAGLGLEPRTS